MPRMRILSPSEQEAFEKPPLFDHRERKKFFEFPKALLETAQSMRDPREFTQVEKEEQEIAEACNRLIKNSIICWNYLYLARQLEKAPDAETRKNILRLIATRSPMSWAHINMFGEYDFPEEKLRDALGILPLKSVA